MLKLAAVGATLIALATGPLSAHEREAALQRIVGPDDAFEMIVATAKSADAPIYDLADTPDALVIHLIGGELWLEFEDAAKMLEAVEMLHRPSGAFHEGNRGDPVTFYIIPKASALTALGRSQAGGR
jgi:hypothetical protein